MKRHEKEKKTRKAWREQAKAGKVNDPTGNWIKAESGNVMHQSLLKGYKVV